MKISVFITSYNQKALLIEAINSVLQQTKTPHQIIIVDDASSDGSQDIIRQYASQFSSLITPIFHTENKGISQVRIDALNAVTGDYVTYVDGDDKFRPQKLELEAKAIQQSPSVDIVFSNNIYVSEDGKSDLWQWVEDEKPQQGFVFWETFARKFPRESLFRMELVNYKFWKSVGFHDPKLKVFEDFDMRIRLTKQGRVAYVDEVLSEIRTHESIMGLSQLSAELKAESLDYIYEKNKHLLADGSLSAQRSVKYYFGQQVVKYAIEAALAWSQKDRKKSLRYYYMCRKYQPHYLFLRLFFSILFKKS